MKPLACLSFVLLSFSVFARPDAIHTKFDPAQLFNASQKVLQFAVIGDYGTGGESERKVARLIEDKHPDFIITLGDNNYPNGCMETIDENIGKYYSNYIGDYKGKYGQGAPDNRFYPAIGNHDWRAAKKCPNRGTLPYLSYFNLPGNKFYYDYQKGPVHFFVLDSDKHQPDGNDIGSKQYQWLKKQIRKSDACFKVVYFHHAPYSSGDHGSQKDMRWGFEELGVDVVMSGHDHHYERIERNGVVYFVNGLGGAELYPVKKTVKGSQFRYNEDYGFMLVRANDHHLMASFINIFDEVQDSVLLTKLCA